jgi:REP-associated tyrosine transposase
MRSDPAKHHRHSIRLKGYDYACAGAYFVTICTQNRECLLGEITNGVMASNSFGAIVQACWDDLPNHYPNMELDAFVIMPNHVHGIVKLTDVVGAGLVGAGLRPAPTENAAKRHGLPEIVRAFKSFSARRINELREMSGTVVWQRNYYEHVIRNDDELNRARRYILDNPARWTIDENNPDRQN